MFIAPWHMRCMVGSMVSRVSIFFSAILLSCAAGLPAFAQQQAGVKVVELYTSQACPHSPRADSQLNDVAGTNNVIALSMPVTYWDYFGWKDTFAKKAFDERQRRYVDNMEGQWLSTPHAVINGAVGFDGSKDAVLADALAGVSSIPALAVGGSSTDMLSVSVPDSLSTKGKVLTFVAWSDKPLTVKVKEGKNAGKTLNYTNVVRVLDTIDTVSGRSVGYAVPAEARGMPCAFLLQDVATGVISAAAKCPRA